MALTQTAQPAAGEFDPHAAAGDGIGPHWPMLLRLPPSAFHLVRMLISQAYEDQTREVIHSQQVAALLRRAQRARAELEGVRG